jgi:BolA protein|tara:strand:- start:276 stop:593 length:318 start_codon:yes stop_codon:yes gene_type:complete
MLAMSIQDTIQAKLSEALQPSMLEVANESHKHGGPATESHFNITAVSASFTDLNLVRRHQTVYKLLQNELAEGVHALAMHLYTEQEWEQRQGSLPTSPDCAGGEK